MRRYFHGLLYLTMAGCPKSCGCGIDCSTQGGYHYDEEGNVDGCNDSFFSRPPRANPPASPKDTASTGDTALPTVETGDTGTPFTETGDTGTVIIDPYADEICVTVGIPDVWFLYYMNESTLDFTHWFQNPLATGTTRLCGTLENVAPGHLIKLNSNLPYHPDVIERFLVELVGINIVNHITLVEIGRVPYVIGPSIGPGVDCAIEPHLSDPGGDLMCLRRVP